MEELNPRKSTRTQSTRTAGVLQFEAPLVETSDPPVYKRIARRAQRLQELGLSDPVYAARLGVTNKTVARAIACLPNAVLG